MERRYLVSALAMILAFAATSHGFRALQQMSWVHVRHSGAMAHSMHAPSCAARALAKIHTHLRPRYPEEAQLLAEMNVPLANMQATIEQRMAQQNSAIAQGYRERAMQDAEHAYRDAMRMQQGMTRAAGRANLGPMAMEVNLPADLDQRINAALASSMAANNVKLQDGHSRPSPRPHRPRAPRQGLLLGRATQRSNHPRRGRWERRTSGRP